MTDISSASDNTKPTLWYSSIAFFVSFHMIAIILAPWVFSWSALGVALFFHWLTGSIGICLGYHRLLTHHSLEVPTWLERTLVTIGAHLDPTLIKSHPNYSTPYEYGAIAA